MRQCGLRIRAVMSLTVTFIKNYIVPARRIQELREIVMHGEGGRRNGVMPREKGIMLHFVNFKICEITMLRAYWGLQGGKKIHGWCELFDLGRRF